MSLTYQLRIEHPEDPLKIYDLDEIKGITTIGQGPVNDILLKSPGGVPFQLVLDYRQQPCHLAVSGHAGPVSVNERAVPRGKSCEIHDQDVVRVAGYTITFRVYADEPVAAGAAPASPLQPEPGSPPPSEASTPPTAPDEPGAPSPETATAAKPTCAPPPDQPAIPACDAEEPAILASLPEQEQVWTIDVGQTISLQLTVINAGDLVAQFNVTAEGVPPEWVTISPTEFHLKERDKTTVDVTITPPRLPTSRAGTQQLTLVVTSPHYPNERSQATATITINPYYELAVGNLSPKRQSISWSQPSGQTEVPLTNKGNSEVLVGLSGEDDALACSFEFEVPDEMDEPLYLTRQVHLRIPFNKTARVPVRLVPRSRPLIGRGGRLVDVRPRVYPYTITVTMPQGQQQPWTLYGEWENSPRFSQRVLLASTCGIILLLLACTCAIFNPAIRSHYANPASIRAGQVVELGWKAWPPFLISFTLDGKSVNPPFSDRPKQTTTYELRADTWLSHLWPALAATVEDTVEVRPVKPDILLFEVLPERVTPGQSVVMSWVVHDADELVLIDHSAGLQETLVSPCGSREIQVGSDPVHYTLRAIGADGAVVERAVAVQVASPLIKVFSVIPTAITSTTDVTLTWWVLGAAEGITLSRSSFEASSGEFVDTSIPLTAYRGDTVQAVANTTVFSLAVGSGATQVVETARVKVLKPTPIPNHAPTATPTHAPTATPTHAPTRAPGLIIVYTALSEPELKALGATPTVSLTEILDSIGATDLTLSARELGEIRATRPVTLTKMLDSFSRTDLTLEKLREFDYVHVVTPTNAVAINILIVRKSTGDLFRQLLAEKENPRADVIWMVAATGMIRLRAEGLLEPLAGLYQPQGLEKIKADWRDPTLPPEWLGLSAWPAAFCVNQDKLEKIKGNPPVPKSWRELTDKKYRDLIVMPNPYTSGTGYMVVSGLMQMYPFGEPDGWAYMDRLHENIASYTSSGIESCNLVAGDSNPRIAIGISAASVCSSKEEAPKLAIVYPEEGSGWEMDAVALVRKDKISKDALAFVAWAISEEAMQKYARFRPGFSYRGFEPKQTCFKGFDEDQLIPNRFLWASANYERITERWLSRYGSESDLIQLEPPSKP